MFWQQFWAILRKNLLLNYRTKDYLKQLILIVILLALIYVSPPSNSDPTRLPYMALSMMGYAQGMALMWVA